ncbi:MAG: ABC transporter ATP-binding protein [Sphingomonadaceae bacterium]|nr:ABC transporter ATP-binding protein [Sphingomonadaceae bacterium]
MPAPAIAFDRVVKRFGDHLAVDHVSLDIPERQFLALVGASGSGKTTLLKLVNRLVDADDGSVRVAGEDVRAADPPTLRRGIGYVFQGIGLFPHLSVAANIAAVPRLLRWDAAAIDARVGELLDLVDLPRDVARRLPAALSGGQRQRVGVARALAARPKVMLYDEPFGALDPLTRDALATRVRALHDDLGLTSVMVTHDMAEALLIADRVVVVAQGRIAADAAPRDLLRGHPDPAVAAMIATPRRAAERLAAL